MGYRGVQFRGVWDPELFSIDSGSKVQYQVQKGKALPEGP